MRGPPFAGHLEHATGYLAVVEHRDAVVAGVILRRGGRVSLAGETSFYEGVARRRASEPTASLECLRCALTLFAGVTTRWWHARTLAELAITIEQAGVTGETREHFRKALILCDELGTGPARALAAELEQRWRGYAAGAL